MKLTTTTAIAAALTAAGALTAANATAVYDADASATLSIVDIANMTNAEAGTDDVVVFAQAQVFDEDVATTGDATADAMADLFPSGNGAVSELVGDTMVMNASFASGTAVDGTATSFNFTQGEMQVENTSFTDSFMISFELTYELTMTAMTDTADETAQAFAGLVSDYTGDDGLGEALSATLVDMVLDTTSTLTQSDTLMFDLLLNPGGFVNIFMTADAEGNAVGVAMDTMDPDVIPLPGALGFMAFGLAGAAAARRRAAKA